MQNEISCLDGILERWADSDQVSGCMACCDPLSMLDNMTEILNNLYIQSCIILLAKGLV